jgi:hypothetical protein
MSSTAIKAGTEISNLTVQKFSVCPPIPHRKFLSTSPVAPLDGCNCDYPLIHLVPASKKTVTAWLSMAVARDIGSRSSMRVLSAG